MQYPIGTKRLVRDTFAAELTKIMHADQLWSAWHRSRQSDPRDLTTTPRLVAPRRAARPVQSHAKTRQTVLTFRVKDENEQWFKQLRSVTSG